MMERKISQGQSPFFSLTFVLVASSVTAATRRATRFRNTLFCMEGTSPASRTKIPMAAQAKADRMMQRIPFTLFDILLPPSNYCSLTSLYLK